MPIVWKGETYYRFAEVAELLGRSKSTVYDAVRAGKLKACSVLGMAHVAESAIDELFANEKPADPPIRTSAAVRNRTKKAEESLRKDGWL